MHNEIVRCAYVPIRVGIVSLNIEIEENMFYIPFVLIERG